MADTLGHSPDKSRAATTVRNSSAAIGVLLLALAPQLFELAWSLGALAFRISGQIIIYGPFIGSPPSTSDSVSLVDEPKISFVAVLVLTALLIGTVSLGYIFSQKFMASAYFQRALIASNVSDLAKAEEYATKAVVLSESDLSLRFLVEIDLATGSQQVLVSRTPSVSFPAR